METLTYPVIDSVKTGAILKKLRLTKKMSPVKVADYLHLETTRMIYIWESGHSLPTLPNMYALSKLYGVPINSIIVEETK